MDGDGEGGRPFGMGRKLASVDLQLLILSLLAEKPRHGYEIIKALEERSKGFYVPSPGMVYPALTYLEEIGHAAVVVEGTRKLHHLTPAGEGHLATNRAAADTLFAQFDRVGERMHRMRRAMRPDELDRSSPELLAARRELKSALIDKANSPAEELQRITEILRRATAEITGTVPSN